MSEDHEDREIYWAGAIHEAETIRKSLEEEERFGHPNSLLTVI